MKVIIGRRFAWSEKATACQLVPSGFKGKMILVKEDKNGVIMSTHVEIKRLPSIGIPLHIIKENFPELVK